MLLVTQLLILILILTLILTETADVPRESGGDTDSYKDDTVPGFTLEPASEEDSEWTEV